MDIKETDNGNLIVKCDGRTFIVSRGRTYWVVKEKGKLLSDRNTSMNAALQFIDTICTAKVN